MRNQRKKIWISGFQTKLSVRIAVYFALYQMLVWFIAIFERHAATVLNMTENQGPKFLFLLMAPGLILGIAFTYDAIKFSHRLVGPIYRFRKVVQAITAGEKLDMVRLRQGDFLMDFKDDLNEMLKVLEERGAIQLNPPKAGKELVTTGELAL